MVISICLYDACNVTGKKQRWGCYGKGDGGGGGGGCVIVTILFVCVCDTIDI